MKGQLKELLLFVCADSTQFLSCIAVVKVIGQLVIH